jgi:hypothetical protein
MDHPAFQTAQFDTNFVNQYFTPDQLEAKEAAAAQIAAKMAVQLYLEQQQQLRTIPSIATNWIKRS